MKPPAKSERFCTSRFREIRAENCDFQHGKHIRRAVKIPRKCLLQGNVPCSKSFMGNVYRKSISKNEKVFASFFEITIECALYAIGLDTGT